MLQQTNFVIIQYSWKKNIFQKAILEFMLYLFEYQVNNKKNCKNYSHTCYRLQKLSGKLPNKINGK